jgi:hypothetical protein
VEPPKKGKGKAKASGDGGGGGSSSKPKAAASSGEASSSQQGSGQRSTPPSASTEAVGQAEPPVTEPALHWTQIKIPPAPTSGTPQEMQAARKERQRVRRLYEAARLQAGE